MTNGVCVFTGQSKAQWKSKSQTITEDKTMTKIGPIHPGEHLAEFLDELGISQYRLAKAIGTSPRRINEIIHGRRSITADTALRLGQALGITPEFWLNLQNFYNLDLARASVDIGTIESLSVAP